MCLSVTSFPSVCSTSARHAFEHAHWGVSVNAEDMNLVIEIVRHIGARDSKNVFVRVNAWRFVHGCLILFSYACFHAISKVKRSEILTHEMDKQQTIRSNHTKILSVVNESKLCFQKLFMFTFILACVVML